MLKVAILISGTGSNMEAILDYEESLNENRDFEVVKVISNKEALGIEKAKNRGYNAITINKKLLSNFEFDTKIMEELNSVDIIVLAGYLSILPKELVQKFSNRIINIHPSLLPKYGGKGMYGINVHKAVLENKEKESGCTVHLVDENIDTGKILVQKKVKVFENDDEKSLQERILVEEHKAIVEGLRLLINKLKYN